MVHRPGKILKHPCPTYANKEIKPSLHLGWIYPNDFGKKMIPMWSTMVATKVPLLAIAMLK